MPGPLIIGAEGVLLDPEPDAYGSSRPIDEGIELARQLKEFPTSRTTVVVGTEDLTAAEYFMRLHRLAHVEVVGFLPQDRSEDPWMAQWNVIERLRVNGPINLVLTAYVDVWQHCATTHQAALLFTRVGGLAAIGERPTWAELRYRTTKHREAVAEAS